MTDKIEVETKELEILKAKAELVDNGKKIQQLQIRQEELIRFLNEAEKINK